MGQRVIVRGYRITIPKSTRKLLKIKNGSVLEVDVRDGKVVLKLIEP